MSEPREELLCVAGALAVALMLELPNKVKRLERELVALLPPPTPEELDAMRETIRDEEPDHA